MHAPRTLPEMLAEASRGEHGYRFVSSRGETVRSYAEIHDRALRLASALRALGLRRGDLVALVVADHEQFLTSFFGASMAGAVPASLYPPATTSDLPRYLEATAAVLRSCGSRAVITSAGLRPHLDALRAVCPDLSIVAACEDARRARHERVRRPFAPTTSPSCSSHPDRRRRRKASSSPIATCRRISRHSPERTASTRRHRTSRSAGCRSITTWASSAWPWARSTRA